MTSLRITYRTLAKSPAFSLTAIAALALGIGANTAIFSLVNQVLLNPAGVSHPERIVSLRAKYDKLALRSIPVSVPDFSDVQKSTQLFESAALLSQGAYNYTGSGTPERLTAPRSHSMVQCFRRETTPRPRFPARGRQAQSRSRSGSVIRRLERLFGQDPGVLGRTIELNRQPYRMIGVMGPEFRWPATRISGCRSRFPPTPTIPAIVSTKTTRPWSA